MKDEEVIRGLKVLRKDFSGYKPNEEMLDAAIEAVQERMERKTGKWRMNSDYPDRLICSECSAQFDVWHWESKQMHYCPNCGAKMEVDE